MKLAEPAAGSRLRPTLALLYLAIVCTAATGCVSETLPALPDEIRTASLAESPGGEITSSAADCRHPLWPLVEGASWQYAVNHRNTAVTIDMSSSMSQGKARLNLGERTGLLDCQSGGISGIAPGIIGHPDLGDGIVGSEPSGFLIPPPDDLGLLGNPYSWELEVIASGVILLPDHPLPVQISGGRIVVISESRGVTPVDVAGGSFLALQISDSIFFEIQVQGDDLEGQSILISANVTRYLAESVGPVKISFDGGSISSGGGGWELQGGSTMELLSYSIPESN